MKQNSRLTSGKCLHIPINLEIAHSGHLSVYDSHLNEHCWVATSQLDEHEAPRTHTHPPCAQNGAHQVIVIDYKKRDPPPSLHHRQQEGTFWTLGELFGAADISTMRGFVLTTVCPSGLLAYLVLFSFISLTTAVSFDLTELRNKVAKIKVNPRGNLWATGMCCVIILSSNQLRYYACYARTFSSSIA